MLRTLLCSQIRAKLLTTSQSSSRARQLTPSQKEPQALVPSVALETPQLADLELQNLNLASFTLVNRLPSRLSSPPQTSSPPSHLLAPRMMSLRCPSASVNLPVTLKRLTRTTTSMMSRLATLSSIQTVALLSTTGVQAIRNQTRNELTQTVPATWMTFPQVMLSRTSMMTTNSSEKRVFALA